MRRAFVPYLHPGRLTLPTAAAHHLTRVLRLTDGDVIELFDALGARAQATLRLIGDRVDADVESVSPPTDAPSVRIASAVPKGDRADWLVEKLAELGVAEWWPLETERSVVAPKGTSKRARWERIAQEAARQSGATVVLHIGDLTPLDTALLRIAPEGGIYGTTGPAALPADRLTPTGARGGWCLIGPEGGWSPAETARLDAAGLAAVSLGCTVLRVETACLIAAAAIGWAFRRTVTDTPHA